MQHYYIFATGNFLQYYYSDLQYFLNFQIFKIDKSNFDLYCKKGEGTFKSFINEYRVARNADKLKTKELLICTLKWLSNNKTIDVDEFAAFLKSNHLTHDKIAISLASKILFLCDPWNVFPYDNQARTALNPKIKTYSEYYSSLMNFMTKHQKEIHDGLELIKPHVQIIENEYKKRLFNIELIRVNRFTDKVLWSIGRNKNNH
jgi:hypothetical protein